MRGNERAQVLEDWPKRLDPALRRDRQPVTYASKLRCRQWRAQNLRLRLFVRLIARTAGLDENAVHVISEAAPFHDVGKIRVPAAILEKPGPLTAAEFEEMKLHTVHGAALLDTLAELGYLQPEMLETARDMALMHHESWDGSGYPYGKKGAEIPLPARIMKLIDTYDALRSTRPWRPAMSHDAAAKVILSGDKRTRPGHFDPELLAVFKRVHPLLASTWEVHAGDDDK
ncbi:MAG: HD domain-containing protein [Myxococcales bacterium]|nr:HD domain-containing protein [Myxococcales bacterium]MCB9736936.1 HD domain-containing protein [Deltaproteobacteria bacterium]